MAITFSYADRSLTLSNKRKVKQFIAILFKEEDQLFSELYYVFCSDEFLLDINRRYLGHDYYTDIITFDLREPFSDTVSGEIYISLDRVMENAQLASIGFFDEFLRVAIHGALHLCGYKDKKKSEIKLMREREEHFLRLFRELYN